MWWTVAALAATLPSIDEPVRTDTPAPDEAAVVVGIERYPFGLPRVDFAQRDADAFYRFLVYTRRIEAERVHVPRDGSREAILDAVDGAVAHVRPGGRVWIYFAGHGVASPDDGVRLLLGDDTRPNTRSFTSRSVGVDELHERIHRAGAAALLVLDTCYTGVSRSGRDLVQGGRFAAAAAVTAPRGGAEWTAAAPDEASGPLAVAQHGAFTYFALGALRGWADGELDGVRDGRVTAGEAHAYVTRALRIVQKRSQTPQWTGPRGWLLAEGVSEVGPALVEGVAAPVQLPERQSPWTTEARTLDNGLRVVVDRDPRQPFFDAWLVIRAGWATEPEDQLGVQATAFFSAVRRDDITAARALGGQLAVQPGGDHAWLSVGGPTEHLADLLGLLTRSLTEPLSEADIALGRQAARERARAPLEDASLAGEVVLNRALYPDHPRGHFATPDDLSRLSDDQVRAWWSERVRPDQAHLVVAGDVGADAVTAAIADISRWQGAASPLALPPLPPQPRARILLVDVPDDEATHVFAGQLIATGTDEERRLLTLANKVFAGGFAGRINQNLRHDKGWTYSARATASPALGGRQLWRLHTVVRTPFVGRAVGEVLREIELLKGDRPLTEDEVAPVREELARAFGADVEKMRALLAMQTQAFVYGLPADELTARPRTLAAATASEASEVLARALDPTRLVWVLVGPADELRLQLDELGLSVARVEPPG